MIHATAELFVLDAEQEELLANKAGLSLKKDDKFNDLLMDTINKESSHKKIYIQAQVSERMFQYIKKGRIPTKESLLALLISLNMQTEEINILLSKAGYVLSNSIVWDIIVKELIADPKIMRADFCSVFRINELLYDLDLPLLMTHEKKT